MYWDKSVREARRSGLKPYRCNRFSVDTLRVSQYDGLTAGWWKPPCGALSGGNRVGAKFPRPDSGDSSRHILRAPPRSGADSSSMRKFKGFVAEQRKSFPAENYNTLRRMISYSATLSTPAREPRRGTRKSSDLARGNCVSLFYFLPQPSPAVSPCRRSRPSSSQSPPLSRAQTSSARPIR